MEARPFAVAASAASHFWRRVAPVLLVALLFCSMGASVRSRNFVVQTADPAFARQVADAAEKYRRDLAISWLGKAMPDWAAPCVMNVQPGPNLGAGGSTTFMFDRGEVFGWRMSIQGSRERLLDSVLPHEITHMILASHFRQPLPRWADEGAATSTECAAERAKHYRMLKQFLCTRRGIAFGRMFAMTEYPADVMPLYAQGFSLTDYLIEQGGRRKFIAFLEDGLRSRRWSSAVERHYGPASLGQLQNQWVGWVRQGHPRLTPPPAASGTGPGVMLASATAPGRGTSSPAPTRSIRTPDRHVAVAGKRPWPAPNLIHRIPRDSAPAGGALASCTGGSCSTAPYASRPTPGELVPIIRPGTRGTGSPRSCCPSAGPISSQMARPQPAQPTRQIILEWGRPGAPGGTAMAGQQGLLR